MEKIKFRDWSPDMKNAWNDAQKSGKEVQLEIDKKSREGAVSPLNILGQVADIQNNLFDKD